MNIEIFLIGVYLLLGCFFYAIARYGYMNDDENDPNQDMLFNTLTGMVVGLTLSGLFWPFLLIYGLCSTEKSSE